MKEPDFGGLFKALFEGMGFFLWVWLATAVIALVGSLSLIGVIIYLLLRNFG